MLHVLFFFTFIFFASCAEIDGICSYSCPKSTTGLVITLSSSNYANHTTVGAEGNFTFVGVPSGTYTLSVPSNPLYYKYTQSITVTSSSQIIQVDFVIETQIQVYAPSNRASSCKSAPFTPSNTGSPGVNSFCNNTEITYSDVITPASCGYTIQRTFIVTSTGNVNSPQEVNQTITVQNNVPPVFTSFPSSVTMQCPGSPVVAYPVASNACNTEVTLTFTDTVTGNVCNQTTQRTWFATDCYSQISQTQTIQILDTTSPSFSSFPPNQNFQCSTTESGAPVITGTPVAYDQCSAVTITESVIKQGPSSNCQTVTNTFTATDQCGLSTSRSQTVIFNDVVPPVFTFFVDDYVGSCSSINTSPSVTGW